MTLCILWLLLVKSVLCMDPTTQDLLTPLKKYGEACGYEGCPTPSNGLLNVHIVPHSHGELGYTKTFYEHYTGYDDFYAKSNINMKRILDYTITELWSNDERIFTLSNMPYFFQWWANRDETVRRMVYQLLRQGRLQLVGGGWGMPDEATNSYHAIIDQFTYTLRKLNATFLECARPLVSWQADSFAHSREFASLMAQMGFDAHFISPISFEDELRRMREKKLEMLWRGSDDLGMESDIFTHKLFDGYWSPPGFCFGSLCSDPPLVTSNAVFRNVEERTSEFTAIWSKNQRVSNAYKEIAYRDFVIYGTKTSSEVNVKSKGKIRLFYSSPACYLKAVHSTNPMLPTKQDDFVPVAFDKLTYFSGLFTSRPTLKYMAREGHVYSQIAKQLQVLARLPDNSKIFEELNWIMGVIQDHNVISGALRPHVKSYYTQKMYNAIQGTTLLYKQAFNKLRHSPANGLYYYRCSFNISSCHITDRTRYILLIYNPLSWSVSLPVRLPISVPYQFEYTILKPNRQKVKSVVVKIPDAVLKIPNRYKIEDYELVFMATDVPALGFRSYYVEKTDITELKIRRRSIIKKINKNKNKKYLIRQANNMKIDTESLLDNVDPNYDYDNDPAKSKIEFGNVSASNEFNNDDEFEILTPKPKVTGYIATEEPVTIIFNDEEETVSTTTKKTKTTTEYKYKNELYVSSKDRFISNKYINISLDATSQVTGVTLSNGVKIALKIQMSYYVSDDPVKMTREDKSPGPYIFRPMDPKPVQIKDYVKVEVLKTDLVEEVHTRFGDYASFALKLYADKPVIEVDWLIGPIPIKDELGKDVFMRYETDLKNNGVFYTDSNGRQTMKRIKGTRFDYEPVNTRDIPGNFYPVTSKIYIEDLEKNIRFSVFNDRAQGGTSLNQGQVDLMVHRRILTDDSGVQTFLNETENGEGIRVRGKHFLYITKENYKPHKIFEKKFAKEIELAPQLFVTHSDDNTRDIWSKSKNEYSGLNKKLPVGVHLLTLEEWNDNTLLIRLENYLEKADTVKDGVKIVFIKDLFVNMTIKEVKETTLDGTKWLRDWTPLQWRRAEDFYESFNKAYGAEAGTEPARRRDDEAKPLEEVIVGAGIKITPQQIRTFVVWFDRVGE